jgi:hypothetical protein
MKHLVGKPQTKKVEFVGDEVEIKKLSVSQVMELQEIIKKAAKSKDQLQVLRDILRIAVVGAEEMTNEDFDTFSPVDLNHLAEEILSYCGLSDKSEVGN